MIRWSIGATIAIEVVSNTIVNRITDFILLYVDEIGITLTLFSVFFENFNFVIGNLEHVLVFFIIAAATNSLSNRANYHPNLDVTWFWMITLAHWVIFEYFILLLGKPAPIWDILAEDSQILAFIIIISTPLIIMLNFPFFVGLFQSVENELIIEVSNVDFQAIMTQIFLLSGALAIIFQIGILVESLVILALFLKLIFPRFGWNVQLEESTVNLISRLDNGPSGFATIYVILVGVYMSSEAIGVIEGISPVLWFMRSQPQLFVKYFDYFIPVFGIIIVAGIGVILWIDRFTKWHSVSESQKQWAGITVIAFEGAFVEISRATIMGEIPQISISNPVVFGFLIALFVVASIHEYPLKGRWLSSATIIIVALGLLGPIFYSANLSANYPILVYPVFTYGLTPVVQYFGLFVGTYSIAKI